MIAPRTALLLTALAEVAGCDDARAVADAAAAAVAPAAPPARPAACTTVAPGAPVQAVLDDPRVTAVCLAPGRHAGPLRLPRGRTLWGPPGAIVRADGGSVITLAGPGASLLGLTIDGTGSSYDRLDGAVHVIADDARVEGVTVINAVFGILVDRCARPRIVGNRIEGGRDPAVGLRGDTIRMWETQDGVVTDNVIEDGRDVVIWYSRGNTLARNRVVRARYGMHFMYSHGNQVTDNELLHGVVGVFVMYSRDIRLAGNLIAGAGGASGMAIGLKDSGNVFVTDNQLIHDRLGVYVDASPAQLGDEVHIDRNTLRLNEAGLVFHASAHDVAVRDNDFADNQLQVRVDGGGDARSVTWRGNYFDDYAGYDLDDDGTGDVAHEPRSLSHQLTSRYPSLALFSGTPALALVDAAAQLDPLYQPHPTLVDPAPRMQPRWSIERARRSP